MTDATVTVLNASHWIPGGSPAAFADWFRAPTGVRRSSLLPIRSLARQFEAWGWHPKSRGFPERPCVDCGDRTANYYRCRDCDIDYCCSLSRSAS